MVAHSARDDGVIELARLCKHQGKIVLPIDSTMDSSDSGICHTQHCTGTGDSVFKVVVLEKLTFKDALNALIELEDCMLWEDVDEDLWREEDRFALAQCECIKDLKVMLYRLEMAVHFYGQVDEWGEQRSEWCTEMHSAVDAEAFIRCVQQLDQSMLSYDAPASNDDTTSVVKDPLARGEYIRVTHECHGFEVGHLYYGVMQHPTSQGHCGATQCKPQKIRLIRKLFAKDTGANRTIYLQKGTAEEGKLMDLKAMHDRRVELGWICSPDGKAGKELTAQHTAKNASQRASQKRHRGIDTPMVVPIED